MNAPIKSQNVSAKKTYTFSVTIREHLGKVVGDWSCPPFEPDHCRLCLFGGDQPIPIKTGKASGTHPFNVTFGAGYRLALVAKDFNRKDIEIVSTEVTSHNTPKLEAKKEYTFKVSLDREDNQAQLECSSSAPFFRPRESRARLLDHGNVPAEPWITRPTLNEPTGLRWGVGLAAQYRAEDYSGASIVVVETPTTKAG